MATGSIASRRCAFRAATFSHDDPVRPHAQAVAQKIALNNLSFAFNVGRPGFQGDNVILLELHLGCIFNGNNAFVPWNKAGQDVQQRCFSAAGSPGYDDIQSGFDDAFQYFGNFGGEGSIFD